MKAVVFNRAGETLQLAEIDKPIAQPGMLLFRVAACGICASDLHAAEVPGMLESGTVLGHEYSGEVVEIGEGVSGWSVGDRLIAFPGRPCGQCAACASAEYQDCPEAVLQGFDPRMHGAYAEYSTCMAELALKIPANMSLVDAAMVEPLAVGLNAWKAAQLPAGSSVLVVGAGIIGLAVAKWATFFGAADVGVSEMVPARQERARQAGVDFVIDAAQSPDLSAEYQRACGRTPQVIFECVGRPIVHNLIEAAPMGSQLVLVGTGMQEESFTVLSAAMKHLRMTFTLGYEPADFEFVLRMLDTQRISVDPLLTATVSLEETAEMFTRLGKPNDHCKVLIVPGD